MKNSKTAAATAATLSYTASPVHALNSFGYSFTTPQNIHYFFFFAPPYQTILSTADSLISYDMCGEKTTVVSQIYFNTIAFQWFFFICNLLRHPFIILFSWCSSILRTLFIHTLFFAQVSNDSTTTRRRCMKKTAKPSSRRLLLSIINKFVYVRMMLMMMMLWSGEEKIFRQSSAEIDLSSS